MWRGSTLPFVLLLGALPGCGAAASRGDVAAAELRERSARAEALREHTRLLELEGHIVELERRLARQTRGCLVTPDPLSVDVPSALERPKPDPLRSQGDFLTEAHAVTSAPAPPAGPVVVAATTPAAAPASDQEHLRQALDGLREFALDRRGGLSLERREALRVLLRHERQLDKNPWGDR
jgi:hypothetical protein